jgi:hypothetical protein
MMDQPEWNIERAPEKVLDPTASEEALDASSRPSNGGGAMQDIASARASHLERAQRLGRQLRVQVVIDEMRWLRRGVELVFTKAPDGTIWPVKVRVGRETTDEDVLAAGSVVTRCAQYNDAIHTLRRLRERLAAMVHQRRITVAAGSPVAYAYHELSRLDELIARRQGSSMSHGMVHITTLVREIEFLDRYDAHLAPIVLAAVRASRTVEHREALPLRPWRRWLRWVTLGLKGARDEESRL